MQRAYTPPVQVFLRKRPIFEKEERRHNDFDVVTTKGSSLSTQLVLHDCLFGADLKTPYIKHLHFEFDHVFGEDAENLTVYRAAASDLVRYSCEGGVATIFMFGQTGSGKTHTMTAIEELAAQDLFRGCERNGKKPWLSVQFVEVAGNRCFDLQLDERPELRLREYADNAYATEGTTEAFPEDANELQAVMRRAHGRRKTKATSANDTSSRSHFVCICRLLQSNGQVMLVDCAGTERRKDSMHHTRERQQEGAEINASLYAVKECVRHLQARQHIPSHVFRGSALTKILAEAFAQADVARLAVICTASPCASDTEHTVTTLRTGMALSGRGCEREEKQPLLAELREQKPWEVQPKQWTPEQVRGWLSVLDGGRFYNVLEALPKDFTGQMLVRLTEGRCVQLCGGGTKAAREQGRLLFELLHQEIDRVNAARRAA